MWLSVIRGQHGAPADVLIEAEPEASVRSALAQVEPALADRGSRIGSEPAVYVGAVRVNLSATLKESPLRDGVIVSIGALDQAGLPEPSGLVEIRVAGGPGAGIVHRLGPGSFAVGEQPFCSVVLEPAAAGDVAFTIEVGIDGTCRVVPAEGVDLRLDGAPVTVNAAWPPGACLSVGNVLLQLELPSPIDAAVLPSDDGAGLDYNRPPRLLPPVRKTKFQLPNVPAQENRRPLPILMAVSPLVMASVMAVVYHRYYYLLIGILSPILMVGNYFTDRRRGKKSHRKEMAEYHRRKAAVEAEADEAVVRERVSRRDDCPDPASLLLTAIGPRRRLWERRRHDGDHLLLRLGSGDLDSDVIVVDPEKEERKRDVAPLVADVPISVSLRERGVVGVAGTPEFSQGMARWLLAQLAVLHSPADVHAFVLTERDRASGWSWARWLPHVRPQDGFDTVALIGNDPDSVGRRLAELTAIVSGRKSAADGARGAVFKDPDIVVFLDGARRLRAMPGVVQLLRDGPRHGMYFICVDADERLLPEECHAVVSETSSGMRVRQMRADDVDDARPDLVSAPWCERVARALAPIRDISGDDAEATLPPASRLLDVINLEPPTADEIFSRWAAKGGTTEAVVGASYDGPYSVDLRRDGPHGLVAGTTGSGKSEFLQSLVASLAVANRPDAMAFVLVDYKGGSAFKDCVQLPHTVGMVTDLDAHLVERALESLGAELRRREHILADAGATDIEDYVDLIARGGKLTPMPRLLIVIDEFASMARELPDFVTGLVNIAQRGRSLGIHLMLATQRPTGVVSPEIRANSNLRIALRVTDTAESMDVIDAPDSARISKSTPGRAYVRLGHGSLVPFQAGRVGGRRPGAAVETSPWVVQIAWPELGRPLPRRPPSKADDEEDTDLKVLVAEICEAARRAEIPVQPSPWLPALDDAILLDDIDLPDAASKSRPDGDLPPVAYGVEDVPAEQARQPMLIDFEVFGHLIAGGAPRTGRSQLLRAMAGSLAANLSCADLHMYGIDCGNGALIPLAELPHCGAVVQRGQPERVGRLIARLGQEVATRQDLLAGLGFASIIEQRRAVAADDRLSHIVVFLDRWEGFTTTLGDIENGKLMNEIMKIFREGASVGVHLVVVGDRSVLTGRVSAMTEERMAFRLADKADYGYIGMNARKAPEAQPPGRVFRADSLREAHIALLSEDASGHGQAGALARIAERAKARDAGTPRGRRPFRIDVLPARISFDQAWDVREEASDSPMWAMLGVGGDELRALGTDLSVGVPTLVIAGPPRSGRSTAAAAVARSLLAGGARLLVVLSRPSPPLEALAAHENVVMTNRLDEPELQPMVDSPGPLIVIVDDAEAFRDCGAASMLRDIIRTGADRKHAIVLAGSAGGNDGVCGGISGWQFDARKGRRGLLLSPQATSDGDLIGVAMPRGNVGGAITPGRGFLHRGDGALITVQVPEFTVQVPE